jgi:putative cell wall-binding protein
VRRRSPTAVALVLALLLVGGAAANGAATDPGPVHPMVFPVVGEVGLSDTFGAPRHGGRSHEGQDLVGHKLQELVAAADGQITYLATAGALAGNSLVLTGNDGWTYTYLHLNNDTPGTDDGQAALTDVYGPGIERGAAVVAGQLLGYLGDSGNAEATTPHLHFELEDPSGTTVNPYASLQTATRVPAAIGATPSPIPRLAGTDRVATAIAAARAGWPDGAPEVVVAAGDRYAEALPATVLAAARRGPLLLTTGEALPVAVGEELTRLGAGRVTVVGSVPAAVEAAIAAAGRAVTRLGTADDPVGTAVAVASAVGGAAGVAVIVNDTRFADGVSATAIAAGREWPVLLSTANLVPQRTVDAWRALGIRRLVIVGGTTAVNDRIEAFARDAGRCGGATGCEVERLAGIDRYATSVLVAERNLALGGRTSTSLLVGTGTAYADVLAAGPLASRLGGVSLLVDGTGAGADAASQAFLRSNAAGVKQVSILGGTGAVSPIADRALRVALGLA